MKTLKRLLIQLNACPDAIQWLQDKTIEEAVVECERADWILWLAERVKCDKRKIVLCGALCANTVRHLMKDERSVKAVDVAIAYGEGHASYEELSAARAAARAAVTDAAWAAASYAASYAARAAASAAAWAAAWAAARAAARAAVSAAARSWARSSAEAAASKGMSEIVKPIIGQQLIQKVNNLLQ